MIIQKFGGTSVASKEQILTIIKIVRNELENKPVLVVSAISGITDKLLSLASVAKNEQEVIMSSIEETYQTLVNNLFSDTSVNGTVMEYINTKLDKIRLLISRKNLTPADLDELVSFGEIISSFMISQVLISQGINSQQVIATKLIMTDNNFQNAEFLPQETQKQVREVLMPIIDKGVVPVVTGFIGATENGQTTTLGRGGSDYSASILGSCLNASEIQIWTDVDGIMTADPRVVKKARPVKLVSYDEASELAILGAKVLHPKTILPAISGNIPVRILNTHNPSYPGTTILKTIDQPNHITSIACKRGKKLINISSPQMFLLHGFLHKLFKVFDDLGISVDFISTSEVSICLTIDGHYDTKVLVERLKDLASVEVRTHRATVSVVGRPLTRGSMIIPGKVYTLFENRKIEVEMICAGVLKVNETIVVKEEDADEVIKILHEKLIVEKGMHI